MSRLRRIRLGDNIVDLRYRSARFEIYSDTPYSIEWFYQFIENAYGKLQEFFGFEPTRYLPIRCEIKHGQPGGIGGWTAEGRFGVEANPFTWNRWCLCISVQELVNLFTGSLSGGWPVDWWADHKSPFPIMASIEAVFALGFKQEAQSHHEDFAKDPLYAWFRRILEANGWPLFQTMFANVRKDGIKWDDIDGNPSKLRTNYTLSYLDISPLPGDPIPNADNAMIDQICEAHLKLQSIPRGDPRWCEFLHGNYRAALDEKQATIRLFSLPIGYLGSRPSSFAAHDLGKFVSVTDQTGKKNSWSTPIKIQVPPGPVTFHCPGAKKWDHYGIGWRDGEQATYDIRTDSAEVAAFFEESGPQPGKLTVTIRRGTATETVEADEVQIRSK